MPKSPKLKSACCFQFWQLPDFGNSGDLLPHADQLHFFALIQIEIEIVELNAFFAAARRAGIKADTVQKSKVGGDRLASGRGRSEAHNSIADGIVRALDLRRSVHVYDSALIGRVLHRLQKAAYVTHDRKQLVHAVAGADRLTGVDGIFQASRKVGLVQQEIIELSAAGQKKPNQSFQRSLFIFIAKFRIVQQELVVQRELPDRVLEVLDAHFAPGQRLLNFRAEGGRLGDVPSQPANFGEEKIAHLIPFLWEILSTDDCQNRQ